jgi:Predicted metal-binding integral membrane protein (DUF2182)
VADELKSDDPPEPAASARAEPGTDLGSFGFYISSWVLMMAAMMLPSIVPMVLVYRLIDRRRRELQSLARARPSQSPAATSTRSRAHQASTRPSPTCWYQQQC